MARNSDNPYRVLIVEGYGSGQTNALLKLINHELDIDKIYLYARDPYEAKYQKLLLKTQMIWTIFIKTLRNIIQIKSKKYWLHLMIWLLICLVIKKINQIVTELFITGRKLNNSLVFITKSYFAVPENIRLNSKDYFVMKIPNKQTLTFKTL